MRFQVCPFHSDEEVQGSPIGTQGEYGYVCSRRGHPTPGPLIWIHVPGPKNRPASEASPAKLGDQLSLTAVLPELVAAFEGQWVEYGVIEHAYATAHPDEFASLVRRYGHTALTEADHSYTVSSFLASALGRLASQGRVSYHTGPGTGRWSYNSSISYWTSDPEAPWEERLTWEASGLSTEYVTDAAHTADASGLRA